MNGVDTEVAKLAPEVYLMGAIILGSLTTLVGVVVLFLKAQKEEGKLREKAEIRNEKRDKTFIDSLSTLGDKCHSHQTNVEADNHKVFAKIERVLDQNTAALSTNTEVLRDVRKIMSDREEREERA